MKKFALALASALLCLIAASCSYLKNVELLSGGEMRRENFVQALPFEWRKDLIVVKARLNADTAWREFIFDTGAFNSKVEGGLAEQLQLPVITEKENSTAQGLTQKIEVMRVDSVQLGETTFYDIGAGKVVYGATSASPCIAPHGIIGANLIKLAHWKIDYPNRMLYFSDQPFEVDKKSQPIPFDRPLLSGTPTFDLNIEGKTVENVLFDVGYNGGLVLPLSLAGAFESPQTQVILDQSTSGIYGSNTDSLLVKNLAVTVGGHEATIPVEFSALNKALLGSEFLKHFTVTIDYDQNEIHLEKQQEVRVAQPRKFLVGRQSDSLWVVTRTTPELPLRLGETLQAVNGNKPADLFSTYCDYFWSIPQLFEPDTLVLQKMDGRFVRIGG